jgi:hypothetical protein
MKRITTIGFVLALMALSFAARAQNNSALSLTNGSQKTLKLSSSAVTTSYTLTFPPDGGTNGYILSTNGSGGLTWIPASSGSISGSGTTNFIPIWTSSSALGSSTLSEVSGTLSTTSNLTLSGANKTLTLTGNGAGVSSFVAGAQGSTNLNYTLPTSAPSANQVLTATSVSGSNVTFGWSTPVVTTGSGVGGIGGSYIARAPVDTKSNTGASSNVAVAATGLSFPIGAGEIWEFIFNITCGGDGNGMNFGLSYPSGATMEASVEGMVDYGASGHTAYYRLTKPSTAGTTTSHTALAMVGGPATSSLMSLLSGSSTGGEDTVGGARIAGFINNTSGSAGNVQVVFASAASADAAQVMIHKGSFVTGWKYNTNGAGDQIYTSSGSFTVPTGITTIYVNGVGGAGGGGGGGAKITGAGNGLRGASGGSGGAGEYIGPTAVTVVPGETLTITVGTGGTAGTGGTVGNAAATNGTDGTATTIVGSSSGTIFSANGGKKGTAGGNTTAAAQGTPAGTGGAGGVTAGSTPLTNASAGTSGTNGAVGTNNTTDIVGPTGGSGPVDSGQTNLGGSGGNGGGAANGSAKAGGNATAGSSGYVEIAY